MNDCVREANIDYKDIELVILTGGSTEIPYIKKEICRLFSQAIISEDGSPIDIRETVENFYVPMEYNKQTKYMASLYNLK